MRIAIALPLLLMAACNVSKDGNGTTTVEYDQNTAESALDTAGNKAAQIGGAIVDDVEESADKVGNKIGDVDVDVDVKNDGNKAN
ncbi:MAG: hypothetical protein ABIO43_13285 [Sphingomicrobium sp.]